MNIILICLALRHSGNWNKIYEALEKREKVSIEETVKVEKMLEKSNFKIMTILDKEYPEQLKQAYKPPFVIWTQNLSYLDKKILTLTGNKVDNISLKRLFSFIDSAKEEYIFSNSFFKGIDKEIYNSLNKPILYITPCGINKITKDFSIEKNIIISEYPPEVISSKETFRARNRLIAAFSENLVLLNSLKDGPINHLVSSFLNLGKEVYCFPGEGSEKDGNSELIKQGANLITSFKDIN